MGNLKDIHKLANSSTEIVVNSLQWQFHMYENSKEVATKQNECSHDRLGHYESYVHCTVGNNIITFSHVNSTCSGYAAASCLSSSASSCCSIRSAASR